MNDETRPSKPDIMRGAYDRASGGKTPTNIRNCPLCGRDHTGMPTGISDRRGK